MIFLLSLKISVEQQQVSFKLKELQQNKKYREEDVEVKLLFLFQPQIILSRELQGLKLPKLVRLLRILQGPMKTKSVLMIIMISQFLLNQVRFLSV